MGFIVGQTMRAMKGKADPAVVNQLVRELMSGKKDSFHSDVFAGKPETEIEYIFC